MKANIFIALSLGFFFFVMIVFAWMYGPELFIPIVILGILGVAGHIGWGKGGWSPFKD